jgi:hypothetical protein
MYTVRMILSNIVCPASFAFVGRTKPSAAIIVDFFVDTVKPLCHFFRLYLFLLLFFNGTGFEAHFTYGGGLMATAACYDLMQTCKYYKGLMKKTELKQPSVSKAHDKIKYALKIYANSIYGALRFPQ